LRVGRCRGHVVVVRPSLSLRLEMQRSTRALLKRVHRATRSEHSSQQRPAASAWTEPRCSVCLHVRRSTRHGCVRSASVCGAQCGQNVRTCGTRRRTRCQEASCQPQRAWAAGGTRHARGTPGCTHAERGRSSSRRKRARTQQLRVRGLRARGPRRLTRDAARSRRACRRGSSTPARVSRFGSARAAACAAACVLSLYS
jgi:hypothetical protein